MISVLYILVLNEIHTQRRIHIMKCVLGSFLLLPGWHAGVLCALPHLVCLLQVLDQAIVDLRHWGSSCSFIIPEPDSRQTKWLAEHKQVPPPVQPPPPPARPNPIVPTQHRSAVTSCPISQPATQTELREATAAKQVSKLVNATKTPLALVLDRIDNSYGTVKANETFL